jgi:hypothetical protein
MIQREGMPIVFGVTAHRVATARGFDVLRDAFPLADSATRPNESCYFALSAVTGVAAATLEGLKGARGPVEIKEIRGGVSGTRV